METQEWDGRGPVSEGREKLGVVRSTTPNGRVLLTESTESYRPTAESY